MKIINNTGFSKIDKAIDKFYLTMPIIVNDLLSRPPTSKTFEYTEDTDNEVGERLKHFLDSDIVLTLKPYKTWNPWSKTIGYSDGTTTIYINIRKINNFSSDDYAGTCRHEFAHYPCKYSHGDNSSKGKEHSVPYYVGNYIKGDI